MNPQDLPVFVVDDDPAVCKAKGTLLLSRGYAVRTYASGEAFLGSPHLDQGGCVLLDLRMEPGISGLEVFEELRRRGSPVVVIFLSGHGTVQSSVKAMREGAADWLEKPASEAQVLEAVTRAMDRSADAVARRTVKAQRQVLWKELTPREIETLDLLRRGFSNKEIGQVLEISENTAKFHVKAILAKLEVADRAEAVAAAFERGLLEVE